MFKSLVIWESTSIMGANSQLTWKIQGFFLTIPGRWEFIWLLYLDDDGLLDYWDRLGDWNFSYSPYNGEERAKVWGPATCLNDKLWNYVTSDQWSDIEQAT